MLPQLIWGSTMGKKLFTLRAMLIWIWFCVKQLALRLVQGVAGALRPQRAGLRRLQVQLGAHWLPAQAVGAAKLPPAAVCLPALFLPAPASLAGR